MIGNETGCNVYKELTTYTLSITPKLGVGHKLNSSSQFQVLIEADIAIYSVVYKLISRCAIDLDSITPV